MSRVSYSPEFPRGSFRDSTLALSKGRSSSWQDIQANDSSVHLVRRNAATQTNYDAEDIQRIFIKRIDYVLGMKGYRPVSNHGKPKLSAQDEEQQAARIVNSKSAYQVNWNSQSKVENVANVKKMRKFEPLRKRTQE